MTDREMLGLAAKSMGYVDISNLEDYWNPLKDSAAALKLAVVHGIEVSYHSDVEQALAVVPGNSRGRGEYWQSGRPMEATRRAIVRAAAAIQKAREAQ